VLFVQTPALGTHPERFRVLEKLERVRLLVLCPDDAKKLALDLGALSALETLCISSAAIERFADLPRGLAGLPRLRRFFHDGVDADREEAKLMKALPFAKGDGNVFRILEPLAFWRAMGERSTPAWYLARFSTSHWADFWV
jgi:hypothetical protein